MRNFLGILFVILLIAFCYWIVTFLQRFQKETTDNTLKEKPKYYCNRCKTYWTGALYRGSGWIELILYLWLFIPGIIYSIWRRSVPATICPFCRTPDLIQINEIREEIECPYCAERILAKAKVCKYCGRPVKL